MCIEGDTLEKLYMAGIVGMANIFKENNCNQPHKFNSKTKIKTSSLDDTNLLIDFLSELLTLTYTNKTIYCKVHILSLKQYSIEADVFGIKTNNFDEEIKAVTYHEAEVKKNKNNQWETCVIFDQSINALPNQKQ